MADLSIAWALRTSQGRYYTDGGVLSDDRREAKRYADKEFSTCMVEDRIRAEAAARPGEVVRVVREMF